MVPPLLGIIQLFRVFPIFLGRRCLQNSPVTLCLLSIICRFIMIVCYSYSTKGCSSMCFNLLINPFPLSCDFCINTSNYKHEKCSLYWPKQDNHKPYQGIFGLYRQKRAFSCNHCPFYAMFLVSRNPGKLKKKYVYIHIY